jgi:hypothetical protein
VGSKVLREMHKKYNESWVVELLFDDLLDWNVRSPLVTRQLCSMTAPLV